MEALPDRGFIFWYVGCGDSTTVVLDSDTVLQIDLHHVGASEGEADLRVPIVDELLALLPEGEDGRPYLAAFGATHLDEDHVQGFAELLDRVTFGDLWFTPRVLWAQDQDELCEDAKAFVKEAERRINKMKQEGEVGSGDRIRIIGYSPDLEEHREIYKDLPEGAITVPGKEFHAIDGVDRSDVFRAFVHAPFKDDADAERNDTSFALQITLTDDDAFARALLLGDLSYLGLKKVFERSEDEDLAWDVYLTPHHCSKSAMYGRDEGETEDTLKRALLEKIEAAGGENPYILASSTEIPASDAPGENPPHAEAAKRYRELVADENFLCTADYPSSSAPEPIIFEPGRSGAVLAGDVAASDKSSSATPGAVESARGAAKPSQTAVGFGGS
jgi:hypothetical protein